LTDNAVYSMKVAIEEARASLRKGSHGFGAVIIRENRVVVRAHDTRESGTDSRGHAEMVAIRKACRLIGRNLSSCAIVCTHEPCGSCAEAIVTARIRAVAYGCCAAEAEAGRVFRNAMIVVEKGIMKEECSILYNREVRKELEKLRGASDDQLRIQDREREARRIEWYQSQSWPRKGDPLEKAYRVLLRKLRIQEDQAPVVRRDQSTLVFRSRNFCPTLEVCKILGMDTRRVCRLSNESSTDALVRQVDGRLAFTRNYEKIRLYSEYCEESVSYRGLS